jgi:peptidoglycan/xylan/chitin deacetylase (PgdA/CDA1 family)
MTKRSLFAFLLFVMFGTIPLGDCQEQTTREKILSLYSGRAPQEWGETVKGAKTRLNTDEKVMALTLDACGGPKGKGYDAKLIDYLENEKIPATLFLSGLWVDANPVISQKLTKNRLFEIENHGLNHKPCSINGRSVYGIKGTSSPEELFDEIEQNAIRIENLTGRKPRSYRPGTGFCDELGVEIAKVLGYEVVNFSVLGDAGATYSKNQVRRALLKAPPSSIILMQMNHPGTGTADGVIEAIPELKKRGFRFVLLSAYSLR